MPCYSAIMTKLIELTAILTAAKALGWTVDVQSKNELVISRGARQMLLSRDNEKQPFRAYYSTDLLEDLTQEYAVTQLRAFGKKNGYNLVKGKKPGEYALVSYK